MDILYDGKLDLEALGRLTTRPPRFAPHEARFWDDPYISRQMLAAHLDPNTDAASRRPQIIDRTVDWLVSHLSLRPGQQVLDLGCGPGLYCERLARRGLAVTGVDFSANSIEYAIRHAREANLDITYVCQDYLTLDYRERFDAICLIYYDFGVLPPPDRDELLTRVRRALAPAGAFVFDVQTPDYPARPDGQTEWAVHAGGFWKPGPYLELTRYFQYPETSAELRQTVVVEADGRASVYRIWNHRYTVGSSTRALEAQGLRVESVWGDLMGQPYAAGSEALGVVARLGA